MLNHKFDRDSGILYINPKTPLEKKDFDALAAEVDPYIRENGKVNGVLIDAVDFPHWKNFEALISHFKFVAGHQEKIKKVAVVSDSITATVLPVIVRHFVGAQIKHFQKQDRNLAEAWVKAGAAKKAS